jgi:hypothetical protein
MRRMLAKALMRTGTLRALGLLKQQRGAAAFHGAVGKLGDFQHRVHFDGDATQLAVLIESLDEFAQIGPGHGLTIIKVSISTGE